MHTKGKSLICFLVTLEEYFKYLAQCQIYPIMTWLYVLTDLFWKDEVNAYLSHLSIHCSSKITVLQTPYTICTSFYYFVLLNSENQGIICNSNTQGMQLKMSLVAYVPHLGGINRTTVQGFIHLHKKASNHLLLLLFILFFVCFFNSILVYI